MQLKKFNLNLYLNYLIVLYAFILPLSRFGINFIGMIIFVLWIIEGNFKQKIKQLNITYTMVFIFGLFILISYLWTVNYNYANFYTKQYWHYFLLSFIIFSSLQKEFVEKILNAYIFGLFISEIISYSIFFGFYNKIGVSKFDPTPFMNHIEYSIYLIIGNIILIDKFFNIRKWNIQKFFTIIFFTTISFNLFIINGRTGQFIYIIVLFIFSLVYFRFNIKTILISLIIGSLGFLFLYKNSPNFYNKFDQTIVFIKQNNNSCDSLGQRKYMVKIGSDIFLNNIIKGVGVGDVMNTYDKYVDTKYPMAKCTLKYEHLHNQYIQILVQFGIIGFILLLSVFYFAFIESKDKRFSFLILLAILLSFMGDVVLSRQFSLALISLMIALILKKEKNGYKYSNNIFK